MPAVRTRRKAQALMTLLLFATMAMPTGDSLNPHVPFFNVQGWMCARSLMSWNLPISIARTHQGEHATRADACRFDQLNQKEICHGWGEVSRSDSGNGLTGQRVRRFSIGR